MSVKYVLLRYNSGLPHAHILLILGNDDKPHSPEIVDCLVCAEIPDIETNPKLVDVITRCNIHGPCGSINTNSPCMQGEGQSRCCSKSFPKPFASRTLFCDISYPVYRRRSPTEGGRTYTMRVRGGHNFQVDNRWVVPYNLDVLGARPNFEQSWNLSGERLFFPWTAVRGHEPCWES